MSGLVPNTLANIEKILPKTKVPNIGTTVIKRNPTPNK